MKRSILALLLLFSITTFSQSQDGINYKALIKDNLGAVVASQTIDVKFTIIADTGPTDVYVETHTGAITDANGIVILTIGSVITPTLGVFADIDWGSDTYSLKVEMDIEQDGSFVDMGTTQFMSVPYALQAKAAKAATELTGGIDQAYIAALEARIAALEPQPAVIGDIREGGVVFWVDSTGLHGLVCALSDFGSTLVWGCDGTDLPNVPNVTGGPSGLGAEIGDGFNNTNDILTDCPSAPAALAARSLGTEWFLPSAKELNEMYVNRTTLEAVAGFTAFSSFYWSSTETNSDGAWLQEFPNGYQGSFNKGLTYFVRAVRAF